MSFMSRGLISYRRLVGSCSKMALDGSIIVEICDETMAKMWRKPVELLGFFPCMLFFLGFFSGSLIFVVCFSLRLLSYGDGDPSKPHLNTSCCCFVLFVLVFEKIASQKLTLPEPYLAHFCDCFGTPLL